MPTGIEWTDETWNPVTGCDKVSQGCKHCYAERMAKRLAGRFGYPEPPNQFDVTLHKDRLTDPLKWKNPRKVFVCSMSDLFHPEVPFEFIAAVFAVISKSKDHIFQVLTKRPERMKELFEWAEFGMVDNWDRAHTCWLNGMYDWAPEVLDPWPPRNAWLGVSAENQEKADERIPILLRTPAAVRFVSAEPLLGELDLFNYLFPFQCVYCPGDPQYIKMRDSGTWKCPRCGASDEGSAALDWVIAGGESGPGARAPDPNWFRLLRDQCAITGTAFFFKQWGGSHHKGWVLGGEVYQGNRLDGYTYKQYPEPYEGEGYLIKERG